MQQLEQALTRFIEQQDQYNQAYGLFQDHDLRRRKHPEAPHVDERISISPELLYFTVTTRWWTLKPKELLK